MLGLQICVIFKHIPSESETVLAMILFANWSGHTESYLSWLAASESQPRRVCEIFQPAVALRLSGEEHQSDFEVISGEEHSRNIEVISGEEHPSNVEVILGEEHIRVTLK